MVRRLYTNNWSVIPAGIVLTSLCSLWKCGLLFPSKINEVMFIKTWFDWSRFLFANHERTDEKPTLKAKWLFARWQWFSELRNRFYEVLPVVKAYCVFRYCEKSFLIEITSLPSYFQHLLVFLRTYFSKVQCLDSALISQWGQVPVTQRASPSGFRFFQKKDNRSN